MYTLCRIPTLAGKKKANVGIARAAVRGEASGGERPMSHVPCPVRSCVPVLSTEFRKKEKRKSVPVARSLPARDERIYGEYAQPDSVGYQYWYRWGGHSARVRGCPLVLVLVQLAREPRQGVLSEGFWAAQL